MLSKALAIAALAGAVAAQQKNRSGDTGHVESDERVIVMDGDSWDIDSTDARDNWKREEIEEGFYTTDEELNNMVWGSTGGSEPVGDGRSRPLCNIAGFENQVDPQGPSDQCCRIYEYSLYGGRFRDFCIQEDVGPETFANWDAHKAKLFRNIQLDDHGWHNEMNSWRCGSMVWMEACQYPDDDKTRAAEVAQQYGNTESEVRKIHCDSGILQNRAMVEKSDTVDQLTIGIIYKNNACIATMFDGEECTGSSKLIRSDILYRPDIRDKGAVPTDSEKWQGSWLHYNGDSAPMLKAGMVESFLMDGGCAIEYFNQEELRSESQVFRQHPKKNYFCQTYYAMNKTNEWEWSEVPNVLTGYSGYKAVNIREVYFPEGWKRTPL